MNKVLENFLLDEKSSYELSESIYNSFKKEISNNWDLILKANDIDRNHNNYQVSLEKLNRLIDAYSNLSIEEKNSSKIIVYTGDPYLTLELLMQALKAHTRVLLIYDDYMLGTNELILRVFYEVLNKYKIKNLVYCISNITTDLINYLNSEKLETIVIGDTTLEQILNKNTFFPYRDYILWTESEELEKLQEAIYIFTNEYGYELEILYEDNVEDVVIQVNNSLADTFILLTNNEATKERIKKEIVGKNIVINANPFKEENEKIRLYL